MRAHASSEQLRHIVHTAGLAPSVHDTQPWRFVQRSDGLELHADTTQRLAVLDPDGRQLHLSCGAALLHSRLAARALGLDVEVQLLPDVEVPEHLATLLITGGAEPSADELRLAVAILHRHTFRDVFEDGPFPPGLLTRLRQAAEAEHAVLHPVTRAEDLIELEARLLRADAEQQLSPAHHDELAQGVHADSGALDGRAAHQDWSLRQQRDLSGTTPHADHPAVVVLMTERDDRRSWLQAGQALAGVLLRAADQGVRAHPLGQVTDALVNRIGLGHVLGLVGVPQLVLRLGTTQQGRATSRRDVEDVMRSVAG